jgi:hypothetical protein
MKKIKAWAITNSGQIEDCSCHSNFILDHNGAPTLFIYERKSDALQACGSMSEVLPILITPIKPKK